MKRRAFLKSLGLGLGSIAVGQIPLVRRAASATLPSCKMVVFGADGLRIEVARQLHTEGAPALGAMNPPICALSGGGSSKTQPGWASIWSGLPSILNGAYENDYYKAMPDNAHIMGKFIDYYGPEDGFAVWISGKGKYVRGNILNSPNYQVYERIVVQGNLGFYAADDEFFGIHRVHSLAVPALQEAVSHESFCCFVLFCAPDGVGHSTEDYSSYCASARLVDEAIADLITILPSGTDIIYCSDHGFNFEELGEVETNHKFAPKGMLSTNFSTINYSNVTRESIGRLIYKRAGGDPDYAYSGDNPYAMYGVDL